MRVGEPVLAIMVLKSLIFWWYF